MAWLGCYPRLGTDTRDLKPSYPEQDVTVHCYQFFKDVVGILLSSSKKQRNKNKKKRVSLPTIGLIEETWPGFSEAAWYLSERRDANPHVESSTGLFIPRFCFFSIILPLLFGAMGELPLFFICTWAAHHCVLVGYILAWILHRQKFSCVSSQSESTYISATNLLFFKRLSCEGR